MAHRVIQGAGGLVWSTWKLPTPANHCYCNLSSSRFFVRRAQNDLAPESTTSSISQASTVVLGVARHSTSPRQSLQAAADGQHSLMVGRSLAAAQLELTFPL